VTREKSDQQIEKELFTICGDPDEKYDAAKIYPKHGSLAGGLAQDMRIDKMAEAHPTIRYKDFLIDCDLYITPDRSELSLTLICPLCHNMLKISSKDKAIGWDGDKISIEPFGCTWEAGRSDATANDRIDFGLGLCRWRVGVENGVARDA
jgi:hypothetical protein